MPLPDDILTSLVDYWSFNQGGGTSVTGETAGIPMVLRRGRMACGCHPLEAEVEWGQGYRDGSDNWVRTPVDLLVPESGGCCCKPDDRIQLVRLESIWRINQTTRVQTSRRLLQGVQPQVVRNVPWSFDTRQTITYSDGTPPEPEQVETWRYGPWTCDDESGDGIGGGMWQGDPDPVTGFSPSALFRPHQFPGLYRTQETLIPVPPPTDADGQLTPGAKLIVYEFQVGCDRFKLHVVYTTGGGSAVSGGSTVESWLEFRLTPGSMELAPETGWYQENRASINATSGLWIYAGAGRVSLPVALPFAADGDGVTLMVRFTRNWIDDAAVPCWAPSVDADPEDLPATESDILAIGGRVGTGGLSVPKTIRLGNLSKNAPTVGDPCCALLMAQVSSGISGEVRDTDQAFVAPELSIGPHIFVLTLVRDHANPRVGEGYIGYAEAFVDGVKLEVTGGGTRLYVALPPALTEFEFGDPLESLGAIRAASLWRRRLTDEEVLGTGGDPDGTELDENVDDGSIGPGGGGGGKSHPWLESDGRVRLIPSGCTQTYAGVAIASEGDHGRQTRAVIENAGRRYTLTFDRREGNMLAILRDGLNAYMGGALNARWRHPADDPPASVAGSPRWKILRVSGIERTAGGVGGSVELELEEV
jgi:hypothetical protein